MMQTQQAKKPENPFTWAYREYHMGRAHPCILQFTSRVKEMLDSRTEQILTPICTATNHIAVSGSILSPYLRRKYKDQHIPPIIPNQNRAGFYLFKRDSVPQDVYVLLKPDHEDQLIFT